MKLFKLTRQDYTTYNGSTTWGKGITRSKPVKKNPALCSSDVLHAYNNINLAFLLNPIHADIQNPRLWEAAGEVVCEDFGKVGCFSLTTAKEIPAPDWVGSVKDTGVRVMFSILCAEAVLHHFESTRDDNRPRKAIEAAKEYLKNPSPKAAWAAARAATEAARAAWTAARAARAAARPGEKLNFGDMADRAVLLIEKGL